jgi:hypothetical protein
LQGKKSPEQEIRIQGGVHHVAFGPVGLYRLFPGN